MPSSGQDADVAAHLMVGDLNAAWSSLIGPSAA